MIDRFLDRPPLVLGVGLVRLKNDVLGAIAEFEKSLIQERTAAGLKVARARGRLGGRPKVLDKKQIKIAESLYEDGKTSVSEICRTLGISRATFYRNITSKAA